MVNGAKNRGFSLYGGCDPADLPRYTRTDASRATGVPASTIGVWVHGMPYRTRKGDLKHFEAVVRLPSKADPRLSFNNLLEVNVLRVLREVHEVRLKEVREAIAIAERTHGIDRLLTHPNLRASGGRLFLDRYFELVELSNTKQLAMRSILEHTLKRVEADEDLGLTFFPVPRHMDSQERPILVSPKVSFGSAIIQRRGVSTGAIASRFNSGEGEADIVADYGLTEDEFKEAILYEAAA